MQIPLFIRPGKLSARSACAPRPVVTSTTLYVRDEISGRNFLVDSGADISLIPASKSDQRSGRRGPPLTAANGSSIRSYGDRSFTIHLRDRKYQWRFVIADVRQSILGADFLRKHGLLVDIKNQCLVRHDDLSIIRGKPAREMPRISKVGAQMNRFDKLLQDRPVLTTPAFHKKRPAHGVKLHISTTGPPIHARARRLPPDKLEMAKKEFQLMERLGIIRKSRSPWSSPLHMVPKKDGGFRPCGDYRRLNTVTNEDKYPIPFLHDATNFLRGTTIYSKIDLVKSYYQIPVVDKDIPKTAVITPFGLYEWLRCPFGLKNAAQAFQRLMHQVLGDLPFVYVYMDDLLCASTSEEEHEQHLSTIFDRLEQHGLIINPESSNS